MTNEEVFAATAIKTWATVISRLEKMFSALQEDELQAQIAPARNRVYYLLGHLTAHHDLLRPLLCMGDRLHPELDGISIANPDKHLRTGSLAKTCAGSSRR